MRRTTVQGVDRCMEIISGSCRFGLWFVRVQWNDTTIHEVRFSTTGIPGNVPDLIRQYCAGQVVSPEKLDSIATHEETVYSKIYQAVRQIPYGSTTTYGDIAAIVRTSPRVVGQAMSRNPTPLVIPCHRVLAAHGIGGFSPEVAIKESLLAMEKKRLPKVKR
jgi:methylated-DNA-[protein]-cysteine S-methyltransferase